MANMINNVIKRLRLAGEVFIHGGIPAETRQQFPSISQDEVEEARQFFPLDKFFIFGHARSGTTLLTRLVRIHPDVHCNYQGHFFTRQPTVEGLVNSPEIEAWLTRRSNRWNRGKDLSPVVLRAVVDFILERDARPRGAKVVGDKSPNSLLNGEAVKLLHKVYPDGKLIFIVRDGRDAAISHRFQTFIDAEQHLTPEDFAIRSDFERDPAPYFQGGRSIFTEKGIRNAATGWVDNLQETDLYGKQLFRDRYHSLRYEDMLTNPWKEMSRIWAFLGVSLDEPVLKFSLNDELSRNPDKDWQVEKAGNLISPLQKGKSGSWQDLFTERDKSIFKKIAGEALISWGYERDKDW